MYGLVNQGVQSFITQNFGDAAWADICQRAGLADHDFDSMVTYPDDVTYRLVDAICDKYEMSAQEVLTVFGDFWVDFAKSTDIGVLLRFGGDTVEEILNSLNSMHSRIKMSMPHLSPPMFEFETCPDGQHKLHYASDREGLEHMVIGLVQGLGRDTGQALTITQDPQPAYDGLRASFTVEFADG